MAERLEIDISITDDDWTNALGDVEGLCRSAALAAFQVAGPQDFDNAEVSILLSDNTQVQDLNREYRDKDKPTNVLSFASLDEAQPMHGGPALLGDIVIAYGVASSEAKTENKPLNNHLSHLVVHGMFHLLGLDHECADEADQMEALEIKTLSSLGIADPYNATDPAGMQ
jgi:probable rRNA maturation factor